MCGGEEEGRSRGAGDKSFVIERFDREAEQAGDLDGLGRVDDRALHILGADPQPIDDRAAQVGVAQGRALSGRRWSGRSDGR